MNTFKNGEEGKFFLKAECQLVNTEEKVRKSSMGIKIKGEPLFAFFMNVLTFTKRANQRGRKQSRACKEGRARIVGRVHKD